MPSKSLAEAKIAAAARASGQIHQAWSLAHKQLAGGSSTNGHGVYMDEQAARASLVRAREHINAALATIDATNWPTSADYNQCD